MSGGFAHRVEHAYAYRMAIEQFSLKRTDRRASNYF